MLVLTKTTTTTKKVTLLRGKGGQCTMLTSRARADRDSKWWGSWGQRTQATELTSFCPPYQDKGCSSHVGTRTQSWCHSDLRLPGFRTTGRRLLALGCLAGLAPPTRKESPGGKRDRNYHMQDSDRRWACPRLQGPATQSRGSEGTQRGSLYSHNEFVLQVFYLLAQVVFIFS